MVCGDKRVLQEDIECEVARKAGLLEYSDFQCDVIIGGFPCQDISVANPDGEGIDGSRSGLWSEQFTTIRVLRPKYVIVENVPALLFRGMGRVLGDLASIGYDAEWQVLSSRMFGANHLRRRVWIIAYPNSLRLPRRQDSGSGPGLWTGRKEQFTRLLPASVRLDLSESELCGKNDGIADRLERLKLLGNGQDPRITRWLGERIIEIDNQTKSGCS